MENQQKNNNDGNGTPNSQSKMPRPMAILLDSLFVMEKTTSSSLGSVDSLEVHGVFFFPARSRCLRWAKRNVA
jgi:hypothetical protein